MDKYQEKGYIIVKKLITEEQVSDMISYLDSYDNFSDKDLEPYSNIPYIYDNILGEDSPFHLLMNHPTLKQISNNILQKESKFYFLKVNNKSKWIGQDICYHQEFAVSKHMGLKENDSLQIFMALEPHTIENGCLKVIEGSHNKELIHEDFFDTSFNHKVRVKYDDLEELIKNHNLINCELEPGDCIIFNQFLVHGSASNKSQFGRKAIVGWITVNDFVFDEQKNKKFWVERQTKTLRSLEKKMKQTQDKIDNLTTGMKLIK